MANVEKYENLVLGSGAGGKLLTWTLAGAGRRTALVERGPLGGACPNVACLPSKNVIHSAKAVSLVHPTRGLGVVTGNVRVDMAAVARRKWKMVNELGEVHLGKFKASGAALVMGEARFTGPKTVEVELNSGGTRQFKGDRATDVSSGSGNDGDAPRKLLTVHRGLLASFWRLPGHAYGAALVRATPGSERPKPL